MRCPTDVANIMIAGPVLPAAIVGAVAVLALSVDFCANYLSGMDTDRPGGGVHRRGPAERSRGYTTDNQGGRITAGSIDRDVLLPSRPTTGQIEMAVGFLSSVPSSTVTKWSGTPLENEPVTPHNWNIRTQTVVDWIESGGNGGWLGANPYRPLSDRVGTDASVENMPPPSLKADIRSTVRRV